MNLIFTFTEGGTPIFSFAHFISALALLIIIYTITDVRYHFRMSIARFPFIPISLNALSFYLIIAIGIGTLVVDLWFPDNRGIQAILGAIFLFFVVTWIYYSFIKPPIFSKKNYKQFTEQLYKIILKGSETELPIVADEIRRSAKSIIQLSGKEDVKKYVHDLMLLIGNRRLCRYMIVSSPGTAIEFFNSIVDQKKYQVPAGTFVKNVFEEALKDKDSILYHEDYGCKSGLIGYMKPFSQSIFGHYQFVENLTANNRSPFDLSYELIKSWTSEQMKVYCRCALITWKSFLSEDLWWKKRSYSLNGLFREMKESCYDIYKLDRIHNLERFHEEDILYRFQCAVSFFRDVVDILQQKRFPDNLKIREMEIIDKFSKCMFDIIFYASRVKNNPEICHQIYVIIFENFFLEYEGKVWKVIHWKIRRFLYDEICKLKERPNYKSASILGFFLNAMGLECVKKRKEFFGCYYAIHKVILKWVVNNYIYLKSEYPEVAKYCLTGSVRFDEKKCRLVRTLNKDIRGKIRNQYLCLVSK